MRRERGIAWVPDTSPTLSRLREITPPGSIVRPFADDATLLAAIARGGIVATVVEAGGDTHELAVRTLLRVHERFPQHPLVVWCDIATITSAELIDVARAGVQEIVRQGLDELQVSFARVIASATQRSASATVLRLVGTSVPVRLRPVLAYAVEKADSRMDLDAFAATFGVTRRTLHMRLRECGLPPTRAFLTWCRLLCASALLESPGHTLDSVAGQMGYESGSHLGNTLRRYTGHGVNALRVEGVLDATVAGFRAAIVPPEPSRTLVDSLPEPSSAD